MLAPRIQKIQSARVKKLQDRLVKLAEDERRTDGTAIRHRDLNKWIATPVSWGYENLIHIAIRCFKDFLEIMGPKNLVVSFIFFKILYLPVTNTFLN